MATQQKAADETMNRMMDAKVSQSEIPGVYDSLSATYDIWGKLAETKARNRALELADIHDGQKILEVAVGTGLAFYEIVKKNPGGTNTGIDISSGMLSKAQKRLRSLIIWRVPGGQAIRKITAKWISSSYQRIPSATAIFLRSNPGFEKVGKEWALEVHETNSAHFKYLILWSI